MLKSESFIKIAGVWVIDLMFIWSILIIILNHSDLMIVYGFGNILNRLPFYSPSKILNVVFVSFFFIVYLISFLKLMQNKIHVKSYKNICCLLLMAISGSIVCVSLNYIVSLLVGFVLKKKYSVILVLLNILSCLTVDILVPDVKKLEFIDIVKGTLFDQILADTVSTCSFHIFLFILGIVLAQEIKQRLELEITNAKLKVFKEIDDISVRNSERIDIARELHDSIGHHLAAISTNLQLANALCKDEAKEPIQDAYDTSKVLMNDIRGIVSALKQDKSLDLYEAITKIIKSIKSPKITFDMDKSLVIQNQKIKHVLFRTVQEIITNAMKYSEAESLFISIKYENNFIILNAKDDGVGCENLKLSNGLSGMTERIEELFGCVEFRTSKNNGFVTNIKIPYGGNND